MLDEMLLLVYSGVKGVDADSLHLWNSQVLSDKPGSMWVLPLLA